MARILLAWEIGEGLGHLARLLPLAERLLEHGHEPVLAVRDLAVLAKVSVPAEITVLQGPAQQVPAWAPGTSVGGYADILAVAGFDHADRLLPIVRAWDALLAYLEPDIVIGDFAPILTLATSDAARPTLLIGDGFTLPPDAPSLTTYLDRQPSHSESALLDVMNAAQVWRGRTPFNTVSELFRNARRFIVTLPEIDLHAAERGESAIGPIEALPPPLRRAPAGSWFGYLSGEHPQTFAALEALSRRAGDGSVYIRDARLDHIKRARDMGLRVHDRPQSIDTVLSRAAVVIHHGGVGLSQAAIAAGRVQVLIPRQLEQRLNSDRLRGLGVAVAMARSFRPADFERAFARAAADATLEERAQAIAAAIAARGRSLAIDRLIGECEQLLTPARRDAPAREPA